MRTHIDDGEGPVDFLDALQLCTLGMLDQCPLYDQIEGGSEGNCAARQTVVSIRGGFCGDGRYGECPAYVELVGRRAKR